jgi:hypothetical protein
VVSKRKAAARAARNAGIGTAVVLILMIGAGVAYTWYMGQQPVATASAELPESKPVTTIKPVTPAENASVGASVQSLTTPLVPGTNANVIIRTHQYAACTIVVEYNKVASIDSGLKPKKADEFGIVSWTWTVEESVPVGKWPVKVTCAFGEKSAYCSELM